MQKKLLHGSLVALVALATAPAALAQAWTEWPRDLPPERAPDLAEGPAPPRDISGVWDADRAGIAGSGHQTSPLTAWGTEVISGYRPGNGPRMADLSEVNDPLSTRGDPAGFPRNVLYTLRPFQIVQTPNQVLMLYMFERRWRVIWTDGRELPPDPDPRWYGYSVGRWEDDHTFVVETVGLDERTWLDNAGNPHSADLRVTERYHRVNHGTMELTVSIDDPTAYTAPWLGRDRLPLTLLPPGTELMEMIWPASEALEYSEIYTSP